MDGPSGVRRRLSATAAMASALVLSSLVSFTALAGGPPQRLQVTKTADSSSSTAGAPNGYTITVSNPGSQPVTIDTIVDDLPAGFTYTTGTTTGATQTEPAGSTGRLTWTGPFTVPAREHGDGGTISIHFGVTTASTPGTYLNSATADPVDKVNGSGRTAPVTVVAGGSDGGSTGGGGGGGDTTTTPEGTPIEEPIGGAPPSETPAETPPPVALLTGNAEPVGDGEVRVMVPGSSQYALLSELRQVPVGSRFDAMRGNVRLTVDNGEVNQTATFGGGMFVFTQHRMRGAGASASQATRLFTDAKIVGGNFAACRRGAKSENPVAEAARRRSRRRLYTSARGRFRTRGRHAVATVRGTRWATYDGCDSTTFKVDEGRVAVRDFRRDRTVIVRAGQRYRAPGRGRR